MMRVRVLGIIGRRAGSVQSRVILDLFLGRAWARELGADNITVRGRLGLVVSYPPI
jgi:hypothetical protein